MDTRTAPSPDLQSSVERGLCAIEEESFPFERISEIAELESWRKEVNRPIYHIHKWWAQRLGSVFRAIIMGTFAPQGSDLFEMFYQPVRLANAVIFDPFMGSGTTIGEALKLGARAVGRDINPVAHFAARNALRKHPRRLVLGTFADIENDVAHQIRRYYRACVANGETVDVLYYFWVMVAPCPHCRHSVDLFSSYIFAEHAYPARNPQAHAVCPNCGAINLVRYDAVQTVCSRCEHAFDLDKGPARGAKATCPRCRNIFPIAKAIQATGQPPAHRLYAKLVLKSNGSKEYLAADECDRALYEEARQEFRRRRSPYPMLAIEPGYNTDQVLNYCYRYWHQMFNDRQLLCLSILAERIRAIPDQGMRELFGCLFSGTLEFNNMFASFKGEGTGAVRHMFSHHILKPERTALEANLWGTPKSSGSFSTLFRTRILRALDYLENSFELRVVRKNGKITSKKVHGLSSKLGHDIADTFKEFQEGKAVYLSCGDSAETDLLSESIDAVVTDPPFFDNVHYSQLADFFHLWQRHILRRNDSEPITSTRSPDEVQHSDSAEFTDRLRGVWTECQRVLKPDGLLVFTYHHSRSEGWRALLEALVPAGFVIVAAHPMKAEMSVAHPKQQAREPIDLDVVIVCRKRTFAAASVPDPTNVIADCGAEAGQQIATLNGMGRSLSLNDVRVVLTAHLIKRLSRHPSLDEAVCLLDSHQRQVENAIERLYREQDVRRETCEVYNLGLPIG